MLTRASALLRPLLRGARAAPRRLSSGSPTVLLETPAVSTRKERVRKHGLVGLTAVHLVDAHHCADPAKFISVLLVTLSTVRRRSHVAIWRLF